VQSSRKLRDGTAELQSWPAAIMQHMPIPIPTIMPPSRRGPTGASLWWPRRARSRRLTGLAVAPRPSLLPRGAALRKRDAL